MLGSETTQTVEETRMRAGEKVRGTGFKNYEAGMGLTRGELSAMMATAEAVGQELGEKADARAQGTSGRSGTVHYVLLKGLDQTDASFFF